MNIPPNSQLARILQARAAKVNNPANPQPNKPAAAANIPTSKKIAEIPSRMRELEPEAPSVVAIDDLVFITADAAQVLGTFWLMRNGLEHDPSLTEEIAARPGVRVSSEPFGAGVYEAVLSALTGG